jgi:hypothetical protein
MNATPQRQRLRGWRPLLEVLEVRLVPATYIVNTLTDTGAGTGLTGLTGDLRYCITQADANPGSTIQFDSIMFATPQTITLNGTELPVLTADMLIQGPAAGVTVSGNGKSRVFEIDFEIRNALKPNVSIANLTITQGNAAFSGAGGGIWETEGNLTLTNCTLSNNQALIGGGLDNNGTATLTNCTLYFNGAEGTSVEGGGIGGGIANGGTMTLTDCTLTRNGVSRDDFGAKGGGIFNFDTLTVTNCTVTGNTANGSGGGIATRGPSGGIAGNGTTTLNNSIVAGNSGSHPDLDGLVQAQYSLIQDTTGVSFTATSNHNLTGLDPKLAPLGNYGGLTQTMPPLPLSPALAAGNIALALDATGQLLTTDQRGLPRIVKDTVDLGAVESQPTITTPPAPGSPATPALSASQRYVAHLYTDLLGRQPSAAEANFFSALVDQGFLTRAQLAIFFLKCFEYFTQQVDQLYVHLLGRHAEPAAQTVGAAFLAAGGQLGQLDAVLLGSDEYYRRHGGTISGFLAGLGQDVAGGALDPGDVCLLQAALASGTSQFVVALQALALPQAAAAKAQLHYQQTLKRSASPSELFLPTVLLLTGNDTAVLLALLSSDEYAMLP